MERVTRIPLTFAAVTLAAVALQVRSTASAADTALDAPPVLARSSAKSQDDAQRATPRPVIERPPGVEPKTAPLEFGFAVVDWLLGG